MLLYAKFNNMISFVLVGQSYIKYGYQLCTIISNLNYTKNSDYLEKFFFSLLSKVHSWTVLCIKFSNIMLSSKVFRKFFCNWSSHKLGLFYLNDFVQWFQICIIQKKNQKKPPLFSRVFLSFSIWKYVVWCFCMQNSATW